MRESLPVLVHSPASGYCRYQFAESLREFQWISAAKVRGQRLVCVAGEGGHRGKLGRSSSNRRCRFWGRIALQTDSQAAPLPSPSELSERRHRAGIRCVFRRRLGVYSRRRTAGRCNRGRAGASSARRRYFAAVRWRRCRLRARIRSRCSWCWSASWYTNFGWGFRLQW